MQRRYSHIRQAAKVEAMQAVESRSAFSVGVPTKSPTVGNKQSVDSTVTH
jgi:hypothetical protein